MKSLLSSLLLLVVVSIIACKQPKPIEPDPSKDPGNGGGNGTGEKITGSISFSFNNKIGTEDLILKSNAVGSPYYINANGDSFSIDKLKYYISNIKLLGENVDDYVIPESYILVDEAKVNQFDFSQIPQGTYTEMELLIGVDSIRNVSGAQTGYLDPMLGMFWDWNTGYIMAMIEGESPSIPTANKAMSIHIGGFKGQYDATRKVKITFNQQLIIKDKQNSKVAIDADILKWFESPNKIDLASFFLVSAVGPDAKIIADNYQYMFTKNTVTNP